MPDYQSPEVIDTIRGKSEVYPPGIDGIPARAARKPGPVRILWAARWEFDKNPETFFDALKVLLKDGVDFRVSVIGERFKDVPAVFPEARTLLESRIDYWGYRETREEYISSLTDADIVVSTAQHEFFGISIVEAIAAGAYPMLPKRLSYPEIIDPGEGDNEKDFYYQGGYKELAGKLRILIERHRNGELWNGDPNHCINMAARFIWKELVPLLDNAVENTAGNIPG